MCILYCSVKTSADSQMLLTFTFSEWDDDKRCFGYHHLKLMYHRIMCISYNLGFASKYGQKPFEDMFFYCF